MNGEIASKSGAKPFEHLKGANVGLFIFSTTLAGVFCFSLNLLITSPWACLGLIPSGVAFAALLRRWLVDEGIREPEHIPTTITATTETIQMETSVRHPAEAIKLLRATVQERRPLPLPHGAVVGADPTAAGALRAYTPDEQRQAAEKIERESDLHEQGILSKVASLERKLPDSSSSDPPVHLE